MCGLASFEIVNQGLLTRDKYFEEFEAKQKEVETKEEEKVLKKSSINESRKVLLFFYFAGVYVVGRKKRSKVKVARREKEDRICLLF